MLKIDYFLLFFYSRCSYCTVSLQRGAKITCNFRIGKYYLNYLLFSIYINISADNNIKTQILFLLVTGFKCCKKHEL